jgi:ribosomal protein S18 acetylase RimI-like enzyme
MSIVFTKSLEGVTSENLHGFFDAWPDPPSVEQHLAVLKGSTAVVLAKDGDTVVGFITAVGDGVMNAHIPLLEVLPEYRRQGIGRELVRRMLSRLDDYYAVDLTCDPELRSFYAESGMRALTSMCLRRPEKLSS